MDPMTLPPDPSSPATPAPADAVSPTPAPGDGTTPGTAVPAAPAPEEAPPVLVRADGRRLHVEGLRAVSPLLIRARYLAGIPGYLIALLAVAGAIVAAVLTGWWWLGLTALLPAILAGQGLALTPRRVRAIGYLEGPEELVVASGVMFRSVETVPYGRVQSVTIDEGPVDRRFELAQLTVTTASDGADVTLPGLPRDEAERLRVMLTERGVELMAAL